MVRGPILMMDMIIRCFGSTEQFACCALRVVVPCILGLKDAAWCCRAGKPPVAVAADEG